MKKFIALLLIVLASCQVKYKKKENQPKPKNILDEIEQPENKVTNFVKGKDFWPAKYYHLTQVTVENPKFKKQEQKLWEICKGPALGHIETYDGPKVGRVAYLKTPILFFTDSGFQK